MTPERWQEVGELYQSALALEAEERTAFLDRVCAHDQALRKEVESLLAAKDSAGDFLAAGAMSDAAKMLIDEKSPMLVGEKLSHYRVISRLGSGGMGDVYLAEDTRLKRNVALKLISGEFARDARVVRRFEQEARAASALNHPNVCVIHDVGTTENGRHFIAMEHIDGLTLRDRLAGGPLEPAPAVNIAIQVADALAAAHAAGILHRDIKPENIMLRGDGYVKVVDFGLAKLYQRPQADFLDGSTKIREQTEPGMRMGTVKYMSPEQLRELTVDERTDVWSLGVVLYEMATGITPFDAPNANDMIALILQRESPQLVFPENWPAAFRQITRKALSKDRATRYRTIEDLASDLKSLRRTLSDHLETEIRSGLSIQPTSASGMMNADQQKTLPSPATLAAARGRKTSSMSTAEYLLSGIKEHKTATIFMGASAILVLVLVARLPRLLQGNVGTQSAVKMTPLTNSGRSVCAAISPDGNYVAHVEEKNGLQQLLVSSIATHGSSIVVPFGPNRYRGVTFSRDGNYLYFTSVDKNEVGSLYRLSLPGGAPIKIEDRVDSPISFSPSGDRVSFVRFNRGKSEYSLMTAAVDGTDERTLVTRSDGKTLSVYGPAWSPDGEKIVCGAGVWDQGYHENLLEINVQTGKERVVGNATWYSVLQVAWPDDKRGLIVSAAEQAISPYQLWRVSYPQGTATRLTSGTTEYQGVSVARDGQTVVSIQSQQVMQIWVLDAQAQGAKAIASTVGLAYGLSWTSKGKIIFSSMAGSNLNISSIDQDGSNQTQLTANAGDNYTPATSPDGRYIVFASNRTGGLNIWRMNSEDGSEAKQLTFTDGNSYPSCSPDGEWILYDNQSQGRNTIWKVSINGGVPVRLSDEYARMPVVSPDGGFIACTYIFEEGLRQIAILPFAGGPPVKRVPIPIMDWQRVQWTKDGQSITYVDMRDGESNIWSYHLATGATKRLTDFKGNQIFAYAWSADQKQLSAQRGSEIRDVLIVENLQ